MSTPVAYNPAPGLTAGNTLISIHSAIADLDAMTLTEANAGTTVHCATEAFGSTTDVQSRARRMIGDSIAIEKPTTRTYRMEQIAIMLGDPQQENDVLEMFELDAELCFVLRPGLQADKAGVEAWATGQKYLGIRGIVSSVDLRSISTSDGDEYAAVINIAVQERTQLFGAVAS